MTFKWTQVGEQACVFTVYGEVIIDLYFDSKEVSSKTEKVDTEKHERIHAKLVKVWWDGLIKETNALEKVWPSKKCADLAGDLFEATWRYYFAKAALDNSAFDLKVYVGEKAKRKAKQEFDDDVKNLAGVQKKYNAAWAALTAADCK